MNPFKGRNFAVVCSFFIFSLFIFSMFSYKVKISAGVISAVAVILFLTLPKQITPFKHHKSIIIVSSISIFAAAILSLWSIDIRYGNIKTLSDGTEKHVQAVIADIISTTTYSGYYIADIKAVDGKKVDFKARLETTEGYLQFGDIIETDVNFYLLNEDIDGFAEERYYLAKSVMINAVVSEGANIDIKGVSIGFFDYITLYRNKLASIIKVKLNGRDSGISSALFLGYKQELSDSLSRDFVRLGISHIISVSGMHLVILMGGCDYFISLFGLNKRKRSVFIIFCAGFYMAITGFHSSVLRAGIILIISRLFDMFGNENDAVTSLMLSVALICLVNPLSVYDVGLQLSMTATFTIIIGAPVYNKYSVANIIKKAKKKSKLKVLLLNFISSSLLTVFLSIFISFLTLPLTWFYFGNISLISPLANILFVPLFTCLLYLIPFLIIFRPIIAITTIIAKAINLICGLIAFLSSKIAPVSGIYVSLNYKYTPVFIVLIFILSVIFLISVKKKRIIPASLLIMSVLIFGVYIGVAKYSVYNHMYVTYLNYKKNDGFVIAHNGKTLLCDISDGSYSISRKGTYEIHRLAYCEIEVFMLTHYHSRHISTLIKLADKIYIRQLWLPEPVSESDFNIYASLTEAAELKNISCFTYTRESAAELDFYGIDILVSNYMMLKRSTHPVIAMSIENENKSLAYIGASAYEVSDNSGSEFIRNAALNAYVVVFGAHGPIYKTAYSYELSKNLTLAIFSGDDSQAYTDSNNEIFIRKISSAKKITNSDSHRIIFKRE